MPPHPTPDPIQSLVLRAYTALYQLRPDWGGSIVLSLGLNPSARALSFASNIAGAVSLSIDNDPAHIRDAIRTGACDFVVNTLDEALRAMKNEVRKHAPLSVALGAVPFAALAELIERGISPQLFSGFLQASDLTPEQQTTLSHAAAHFHSLAASLLHFNEDNNSAGPNWQSSPSLLAAPIEQQNWILHTFTFETPAALRDFDAKALALLPPEDTLRRRWLLAAPRVLHRLRPPHRSLWLNEAELQILGGKKVSS
jgi:hypothetical protein